MPSSYYVSSDDLILGMVVFLVLLFVGYLFRLQIKQVRGNNRVSSEKLRSGLIQDVTGSPRPKAARNLSPVLTLPTTGTATASGLDMDSKRWTGTPLPEAAAYHWN